MESSISYNHKSVLSTESGFTLIEAMVAFMIFVIGILGAYKLQILATGGNTLANRVSTSTQWGAFAMEEILGKDYDDPDLDDDNGGSGVASLDEVDVEAGEVADGAMYILRDGNKEYDLSKKSTRDPYYVSTYTAPADPLYTIYWNVAIGDNDTEMGVLNDVKRIRVRVFREGGVGDGNIYNHDYYKARWPESL